MRSSALSVVVLLGVLLHPAGAASGGPPGGGAPLYQRQVIEDGYSRPRALLYDPADQLLYVALSTANRVALIDTRVRPARVVGSVRTGRFPQALALLPSGGVLVSCRFEPELGVIEPVLPGGERRYRSLPAGPEHGHRGVQVNAAARVAYVASPPAGGVKVVALDGGGVLQTLPTGLSPRALYLGEDPRGKAKAKAALLLVANFISHTVTVHPVGGDGLLGAPVQVITTDAPVQELTVVPLGPQEVPTLLLLTHEDQPVDRGAGPVTGLDSVVLALPSQRAGLPFADAGPGRRHAFNLTERRHGGLAKLDALAYDPGRRLLALAGAATDNLLVTSVSSSGLPAGRAIEVGPNPVALAFLPDGRLASADRLGDLVSIAELSSGGPRIEGVVVGRTGRRAPAELGELLFYSRALTPNNVADGPLSVYACSACHDDGHVDGRRHPARRNRFRSMTKTCRALGTTAPYLSLGELATLSEFADNILSTHAQGEELAPRTFDQYPVTLRLPGAGGPSRVTLTPAQVREAMAAYLMAIPSEPSPFVSPRGAGLGPEAQEGLRVFMERCARCHQTVGNTTLGNRVPPAELPRRLLLGEVALTSTGRYDVGTPVLGKGGNNPPSLRGVWDAAPYLSDGSAATLEALLLRTDPEADLVHAAKNEAPAPRLSAGERRALLSFLRSL